MLGYIFAPLLNRGVGKPAFCLYALVILNFLSLFLWLAAWNMNNSPRGSSTSHGVSVGNLTMYLVPPTSIWTNHTFVNSLSRSTMKAAIVLISYVAFAPQGVLLPSYDICKSNLDFMITHGMTHSPLIHYVFTLIGDTKIPKKLLHASLKGNVELRRENNLKVELFTHSDLFQEGLETGKILYFVAMNCGVRGPYYSPLARPISNLGGILASLPRAQWLDPFISRLSNHTCAVGATQSCESRIHVQSYVLALNSIGAQIAVDHWNQPKFRNNHTKLELIAGMEVGLSELIELQGFAFDSLVPLRSFGNMTGLECNPTSCRSKNCTVLYPCEVVFVKNGGEVANLGLLNPVTLSLVNYEDRNMCLHHPKRPRYDFHKLNARVTLPKSGNVAVIIRAHAGYRLQLMSMLYALDSVCVNSNLTLSAIVLPLDCVARTLFKKILLDFRPSKLVFSLVQLADNIYTFFDTELSVLCNGVYFDALLRSNIPHHVQRFCGINSPLHYALVDLVLAELTSQKDGPASHVLVTNADNMYSARFFENLAKELANSSVAADYLYSGMVWKGQHFPVKPAIHGLDLGGYVVSLAFLRKNLHISFLNSIPDAPSARDYHDADGHFINQLNANGARHKMFGALDYFHE